MDDFHLWASMGVMRHSDDHVVKELSDRLVRRDLYKSVDVQSRLAAKTGEAGVAKFRARLTDARANREFEPWDVLDDFPTRTPYKRRGFDSPEALTKVLIRSASGLGCQDLAERSDVVRALEQRRIFRVCVRNEDVQSKVDSIIEEVSR